MGMSEYEVERSPEVQGKIDKLCKSMFGISNTAAGVAGICVSCGSNVSYDSFRDELSRKEYGLSRLCQKCQDLVFGRKE